MSPDMAPFIAVAWIISGVSLAGLTFWSLWRYTQRDKDQGPQP